MVEPQPIPGPPGLPLVGNLADLDPVDGIGSLGRLADEYGILSMLSTRLHQLTQIYRRDIQA